MTSSPALIHDYLLVLRGAERTFAVMSDCWPKAPIYTTVYSERGTMGRFVGRRVETSPLQRLRVRQRWFRVLLPLYPRAVESLPLAEHELLISSSSAFALGVRPSGHAVHVCYCHTPFRYVWHERERVLAERGRLSRPVLAKLLDRLREWDREAATRVGRFIANSAITRERIRSFYGREANVVHPPVDVARHRQVKLPADAGSGFLIVSALVPHKRVAVALEAVKLVGSTATVVGDGPELGALRRRFRDIARFAGRLSDRDLDEEYRRARALVVPNVEEFGMAAVEAQAAGRPVVALAAGGAQETVVAGRTGVLVPDGSAEAFADALNETDFASFDPAVARQHAENFSAERFRERLRAEVQATRAR